MTSIYREVCKRTGSDWQSHKVSDRTANILRHYQRTLNRSRRGDDRLYIDLLVQRCIANLAGANGDRDTAQRTRVRL